MPPPAVHEPNPRRVAAGRENQKRRNADTDDGRERLRAAALRNRPWLQSTGPRTPEGKARAAENGRKRQTGSISTSKLRSMLAEVRSLRRSIAGLTNRQVG
jgi:hypothetical protein